MKYVTTREFADRYGVSLQTVWNAIHGKGGRSSRFKKCLLKAENVGGHWLIPRAELKRWRIVTTVNGWRGLRPK